MPNSSPLDFINSPGLLLGFLFVLSRVAGIFVFAPVPGMKNGPDMLRVLLALAITVALYPVWPHVTEPNPTISFVVAAIFSEAAFGLAIGLAVAFTLEALQMAAQVMGVQAGYGYASTIDPATQADSPVLLVFAQLFSGLLFFATGLDREIIRACALSLQTIPPGSFTVTADLAHSLIRLSSGIFSIGMRLALPAVALLGMLDLSLALLGRVNSQLQLITLAFPVKMLAALVLLAFTGVLFARMFSMYSGQVLETIRQMVALPVPLAHVR